MPEKKQKKLKDTPLLSQVQLERELWNAALRVPPPFRSKKTYSRKGKSRYRDFDKGDLICNLFLKKIFHIDKSIYLYSDNCRYDNFSL